ncbi:MAG: DUF2946 family protein [Hyphomonadaceae bacterium]
MLGRGAFLKRLRLAGFWLAFCALVFKAAIPAGYMIGADAGDRIAVTLCSLSGDIQATLDLKTGRIVEHGADGHQTSEGGDHPCAFALAAAPLAPSGEAALAAPIGASLRFDQAALALRPQITPTGPPLPARGPPQYA